MLIQTPDMMKVVDDYDITFEGGVVLPFTIDSSAGDSIQFDRDTIKVFLVAKPSTNDPAKTLPAEELTLTRSKILCIQHRVREVVLLTPEQQKEWEKTFKELTTNKTVQ